jgi:hypothetical protein
MTILAKRPLACLVLCLAMTGCVSSQDIAAADNQECIELGFEPGTEAYGNCRLKLREIRAMERQTMAVENTFWYGRPYWW